MFKQLRWILLFVVVTACDEKKPSKAAEALSSARSSASVAKQASASASVDPKEEKFVLLRKSLKEKSNAYMGTLQELYKNKKGAKEEFKQHFSPDKDGEKSYEDISKEATFTGKEGMSISKFEVLDVNLNATMSEAKVDVWEEQTQRGKSRCITYQLVWKEISGKFYRTDRVTFRIVECSAH